MTQPKSKSAKRLPEMNDWQSARERARSIEDDVAALDAQSSSSASGSTSSSDGIIDKRKLTQLRYDFDRHTHEEFTRIGDTDGDTYTGHFKVVKYTDTSVVVGNGYIALRDLSALATGGALNIGATAGYHYVLLRVWFNVSWKYDIIDSIGGYPNRLTTISDGGSDFDGYQQVLAIVQVFDGIIIGDPLTQIIHDEVVNLLDWTRDTSVPITHLFKVTKNGANEVAITSGVVINGTNTLQISNTTESVSTTNTTYYLSLSVYYDLDEWTSLYEVDTSYPVQAIDELKVLIATIVVTATEISTIIQQHPGGEILNPRVAE